MYPPPSLAGAQGAPEGNGEEVVNNPEIDIVEIIDITDDEPNSNDDPPRSPWSPAAHAMVGSKPSSVPNQAPKEINHRLKTKHCL